MPRVPPTALQAHANADPEFRLAARYWHATLSVESPTHALRIAIEDGEVTTRGETAPGQPATITVVAPEAGWTAFLALVPRPFYQDLLGGCMQHYGFTVAGDLLSLTAYYQATQRLFALMRVLRASPEEASHGTL
jgi:hypothetical protein